MRTKRKWRRKRASRGPDFLWIEPQSAVTLAVRRGRMLTPARIAGFSPRDPRGRRTQIRRSANVHERPSPKTEPRSQAGRTNASKDRSASGDARQTRPRPVALSGAQSAGSQAEAEITLGGIRRKRTRGCDVFPHCTRVLFRPSILTEARALSSAMSSIGYSRPRDRGE